jgi:hypothetical protein
VLTDIAYPASALELEHIKAAAPTLGFDCLPLEVRRAEEIEPAFAGLNSHADAVYVCSADPLMNNNRDRINALAFNAKLPTLYGEKPYAEAGGLIACSGAPPSSPTRSSKARNPPTCRSNSRTPLNSSSICNSADAHCDGGRGDRIVSPRCRRAW